MKYKTSCSTRFSPLDSGVDSTPTSYKPARADDRRGGEIKEKAGTMLALSNQTRTLPCLGWI